MSKIKVKCDLIAELFKAEMLKETIEVDIIQTLGEEDLETYLSTKIRDEVITLVLNIDGGVPTGNASDGRYVNEMDNITCWLAQKGKKPTEFPESILNARETLFKSIQTNVNKFIKLNGIGISGWRAQKFAGETWRIEFQIF